MSVIYFLLYDYCDNSNKTSVFFSHVGKELKRMKMLNVLSKYPDSSITPQGPKLPAPGTTILQVKQES